MEFKEYKEGDLLVVQVSGKIDNYSGKDFYDMFISTCHRSDSIRLDLTEVPYFSSAGIRGLIMGQKVLNLKGGTLEIYGANELLLKLFKDTGLDRSLTINSDDKEDDNAGEKKNPVRDVESPSPHWVLDLFKDRDEDKMLIIAVHDRTTAWISLHEKDSSGNIRMVFTTTGFIGREGLSADKEPWTTRMGFYRFSPEMITVTDDRRPFTDGRVAIPAEKCAYLLTQVDRKCLVAVDTLENFGGSFDEI